MTKPTIDELEIMTPDQLRVLFHIEVKKASPDVQHIKDLIAVGCPIEDRYEYGWTALHLAALGGYPDIAEVLLSNGADIEARDKWNMSPLHWAAWAVWHIEMVKFLISKGAQVNARDIHGHTAWDIVNGEKRILCPELRP